jgi:hypothetical protein
MLTERDKALVDILIRRVRVMSVDQVARTFWPTAAKPVEAATKRLHDLAEEGWVTFFTVMAHPELQLEAPLTLWQPGTPPPDFGPIAQIMRSRWSGLERNTEVVSATARAGTELGGHGGRIPRPSETTHDLHLSSVYLAMRKDLPTRTQSWRCEADIAASGQRHGQKLPDAVVRDGRSFTAIEFGGAYPRPKLEEFHSFCAGKKMGYEIW